MTPPFLIYTQCVLLQETAYSSQQLYAKIGCMERETFTSTKLALHLYTDEQCSRPYDDGESSRRHSSNGYEINGYTFSTHVSFRPPFYTCATCQPDEISETFNKRSGSWYDDDYISQHGSKYQDSEEGGGNGDDDAANGNNYGDDNVDDMYLAANDDIYRYGNNDDYYNGRSLSETTGQQQLQDQTALSLLRVPEETRAVTPAEGVIEVRNQCIDGMDTHVMISSTNLYIITTGL